MHLWQDALLDEEGARPEGGAANAVSLRGPQAAAGGPAPGSDAAHEVRLHGPVRVTSAALPCSGWSGHCQLSTDMQFGRGPSSTAMGALFVQACEGACPGVHVTVKWASMQRLAGCHSNLAQEALVLRELLQQYDHG